MTDIILPTSEQEQRARWDLLLLDIEHRTEQLRRMKTYEPLDIEHRTEQLRQMKTYEPKRLWIQAATAFAAVFGTGAAAGALIVALLK